VVIGDNRIAFRISLFHKFQNAALEIVKNVEEGFCSFKLNSSRRVGVSFMF